MGQQTGEGQRVGLEGQTEDIEASCRDPHLQKCVTCGRGSRVVLAVPEGSDNKVYFCVRREGCNVGGAETLLIGLTSRSHSSSLST